MLNCTLFWRPQGLTFRLFAPLYRTPIKLLELLVLKCYSCYHATHAIALFILSRYLLYSQQSSVLAVVQFIFSCYLCHCAIGPNPAIKCMLFMLLYLAIQAVMLFKLSNYSQYHAELLTQLCYCIFTTCAFVQSMLFTLKYYSCYSCYSSCLGNL